jgi:hypothetical protein
MALSEYEQRKLDDIERSLHSDDPGLGAALGIGTVRGHRPGVAVLIFGIGFVALIVGAITAQSLSVLGVVVSVLGFLMMVGGAGLFASGRPRPTRHARVGGGASPAPEPSWRNRMQERFRGRFDHPDE